MINKSWFKRFSVTGISLWLFILVVLPALLLFSASFLSYDNNHFIIFKFSGKNYAELIDPLYLKVFWQSFKLSFITTLLCLLLGYPAAYFIAQVSPKYKSLLLLLLLVPFWTSSLIRTYAMIALLKTHGLINSFLLWLGIIHQPLQLLYNEAAVLAGLTYALLPYMILPIYANVEKLDYRLIDAAKDLGANWWMRFSRIILPLTVPGIINGILLVFLPSMTLFYIPVLLGGQRTLLVGNLIESQFLEMQAWPAGAVTSVTLTIIMLILIALTKRFLKNKQVDI